LVNALFLANYSKRCCVFLQSICRHKQHGQQPVDRPWGKRG